MKDDVLRVYDKDLQTMASTNVGLRKYNVSATAFGTYWVQVQLSVGAFASLDDAFEFAAKLLDIGRAGVEGVVAVKPDTGCIHALRDAKVSNVDLGGWMTTSVFTVEWTGQTLKTLWDWPCGEGSTLVEDNTADKCSACDGAGKYVGFSFVEDPCKACGGSGVSGRNTD